MSPADQVRREVLISDYVPVGEESTVSVNRRMETLNGKALREFGPNLQDETDYERSIRHIAFTKLD